MTDPLTQLSLGDGGEPSAEFSSTLRTRIDAIEARANRARPRGWHLAQLNLGVFKAPLDSPEMAEFAAALDRINAIAEESPGFIWRLVDDDGGSSSYVDVPGATDPLLAPNLSVWTDLESLRGFMFRTDHATYLRRRTEWFQRHGEAMTVGWWIPAGEIPTLVDAMRRLHHLREHGPSDIGFPLSRRIPHPPSQPASTTPTETTMTQSPQTLIPYLAVSDARAALQFYAEVFGAEQSGESFEMDAGRIGHAEMTVNGATFYLESARHRSESASCPHGEN